MSHIVVVKYPLEDSAAIIDEMEIAFIGHTEQEVQDYLKAQGATVQDIFYVSTSGDRPGDWPDVLANSNFAFEIKGNQK